MFKYSCLLILDNPELFPEKKAYIESFIKAFDVDDFNLSERNEPYSTLSLNVRFETESYLQILRMSQSFSAFALFHGLAFRDSDH
jgi:hypothetical protein